MNSGVVTTNTGKPMEGLPPVFMATISNTDCSEPEKFFFTTLPEAKLEILNILL
jgi:hypothetical protein